MPAATSCKNCSRRSYRSRSESRETAVVARAETCGPRPVCGWARRARSARVCSSSAAHAPTISAAALAAAARSKAAACAAACLVPWDAGDGDRFVIVASDGLWDVCEDAAAVLVNASTRFVAGEEFGDSGDADYVIEGRMEWDTFLRNGNLFAAPTVGSEMGFTWLPIDPDGEDAYGGQIQCVAWAGGNQAEFANWVFVDTPAGPSGSTAVEEDSWGRIKTTIQ